MFLRIWTSLNRFLSSLTAPVAPVSVEEWVVFILCAVLVTLLVWYTASILWAFVRSGAFNDRRATWRGGDQVRLAAINGALTTAFLWTAVLIYTYVVRSFEAWLALVPFWVGFLTAILIASYHLAALRAHVRTASKALARS